MRLIDQTKIVNKYHGQWVVLNGDYTEVIASGKTLKSALIIYRQEESKTSVPSVFKVPNKIKPYIGGSL